MLNRRSFRLLALSLATMMIAAAVIGIVGCGDDGDENKRTDTEGRPESVTAYEAVQYTKPAADKWQDENWMIQVKDGDPDGIGEDGKGKIWEVYYFSPTPEEKPQLFIIYNRGRVWPNVPTRNKGGDEGRKTYVKNEPPDFRVDSNEAYSVAFRNGGSEFLEARPDALAHVALRAKADYDAIGEKMPAPKYKWIWDVSFREPKAASEVLHVYVDGMNGDFISKELVTPPN